MRPCRHDELRRVCWNRPPPPPPPSKHAASREVQEALSDGQTPRSETSYSLRHGARTHDRDFTDETNDPGRHLRPSERDAIRLGMASTIWRIISILRSRYIEAFDISMRSNAVDIEYFSMRGKPIKIIVFAKLNA